MAQGRPRFWCDVLQAHVLRAQGPGPVITLTDDLSHSWLLAELPAFMEAASNHFRSCVHSSWQLLCGDGCNRNIRWLQSRATNYTRAGLLTVPQNRTHVNTSHKS